jgi:signal peptidase I
VSEHAPPPPVVPPASPRRRWVILVLIVAIPIAAAVVLGGLALQLAGWRPFNMASASMLPGLLVTDRFFVDRQAYADDRRPKRGDVAVFILPASAGPLATGTGGHVEFVKRIVGLPGEQIAMRKGVPVINGQPASQEKVGELVFGPQRSKATRLHERFVDGTAFEVLKYTLGGALDEGGPITVPAGSYFVLGDNRDDSLDSRSGWWSVPAENLIGRANYIYWSGFDRLDRIGTALK